MLERGIIRYPLYKEPKLEVQYAAMPLALKDVATLFVDMSYDFDITPVVTRITDAVPGDSGVHEAHRGIDFRDDGPNGRLYTDKQADIMVEQINSSFPRKDGKLCAKHHSFDGGPMHMHLQIPIEWVKPNEV